MGVYVARPDKPNGGGILVFQEAFGVNAHIRDIAGRFANLGLTAVAPDSFIEPARASRVRTATLNRYVRICRL